MGKAILESSNGTRLGKSFKLGMLICQPSKRLFLSVYVNDIKLAGKTENIEPTWHMFMQVADLGESTSFLDHENLGCTQRKCKIRNEFVKNTEICSNPGFLLEPRKNYLPEVQGNLMQKQYLLGPMTWKVTRKNVWKDIANLQFKRLNNNTKTQHHALVTINLTKKKMLVEPV